MSAQQHLLSYVIAGGRVEKDAVRRDALAPAFGYFLLVLTVGFFVCSLYALVFSKLMPDTGYPLLDAVKADHYYCYLVPACIPAAMLFVYSNWLSLKFFRQN